MKVLCWEMDRKRKRGLFTSSTLSEVLGKTDAAIGEQMPTPSGVNVAPSFYAAFLQIPQLSEMQEIKFYVSISCCLYLVLCHTQ